MQKSIEKTMYLGIDFLKNFDGFLREKWRYVGTNIEKKSMPTSKNDFLTKPSFTLGKTMILRVQGIEVGGKNRWKIDPKMESRWEGICARLRRAQQFLRFTPWGPWPTQWGHWWGIGYWWLVLAGSNGSVWETGSTGSVPSGSSSRFPVRIVTFPKLDT